MSRAANYHFVETDTTNLEAQSVSLFESITGSSVQPASPEKLFIQWFCSCLLLQRILLNYTGNQNIPSRAEGINLDTIGEQLYMTERPQASAAVSTIRFSITQAQETALLIPAGTRVSDASDSLIWETTQNAVIPAGELSTEVPVRCQKKGTVGNGYLPGQLNKLVDVFPWYDKCENITTSDGGANEATDDEYYELLRASVDKFSCAGAKGSYIYFAKQASAEVGDVIANSHAPGYVDLYVMAQDGKPASEELKNVVLNACNPDTIRAFTDFVSVHDPEFITYNINLTYYLYDSSNAIEIQNDINTAIQDYISWQSEKIGRDINPSELIYRIQKAGAKRVIVREPTFISLRDGNQNNVPQIAILGETKIINGGFENE